MAWIWGFGTVVPYAVAGECWYVGFFHGLGTRHLTQVHALLRLTELLEQGSRGACGQDDLAAQLGIGGQHAQVVYSVAVGRRDDRSEMGHEFQGREGERCRAVRSGSGQAVHQGIRTGPAEAALGEGRPSAVPGNPLKALAVPREAVLKTVRFLPEGILLYAPRHRG